MASDQGVDLGTIAPDEEVGPRVREEVSTIRLEDVDQGVDLGTITEAAVRVPGEIAATLRLGFQEFVRGALAFTFAALLFVVVILAFRSVYNDAEWKNTKELLQVLLPAITALLGSALGFYFGARSR